MPTRPTAELIAPGALDAGAVSSHLREARRRLVGLTEDLDGGRLLGPRLAIVNPVLWELGHVGWFQERWCLRLRPDGTLAPGLVERADALYDSGAVPHAVRWDLPLLPLGATRAYLDAVLERLLDALRARPGDDRLCYFAELAACHEDMHAEAFHYTRQTLGYPAPPLPGRADASAAPCSAGDAAFPGGRFRLGASASCGFVFDNEKWAHEVALAPFRMARAAVRNREFAEFVDAGGYARREWWSDEGWGWRAERGARAPRYWLKRDGVWGAHRFGRWSALEAEQPVIHVSWHEAQAYCRFAGRRLPTESEWEYAACNGEDAPKPMTPWGGEAVSAEHANVEGVAPIAVEACVAGDTPAGCRQLLGNVWEWTATAFMPYPGFTVDPYRDYSQPWFGTHKVLRGGSFATPARLLRNTWRNFYLPDRDDVFCGFRTCALE